MSSTSDLAWFKSSHSGSDGDACVEVAFTLLAVHVQDSKDKHGPRLTLSPTAWRSFVSYAART